MDRFMDRFMSIERGQMMDQSKFPMSATHQNVTKTVVCAQNVTLFDVSRVTGYESKIRVGLNEWGLLVTPVNDGIRMCTGQDNNLAGGTWNNLSEIKKTELQSDLVDVNGE